MGVFSDNCDKLWAAGLPVMPIREAEKRPFLHAWQRYGTELPSPEEQALWRRVHPNCNLGLPLGPCSRMFALDVDTDDTAVLELIRRISPKSPWERVGKKGLVIGFKYTNQAIIRIRYRIKSGDNAGKVSTLIDMLGAGSQVVLPPSIHPDTGQPYWASADLADVIDDLPILPETFEAELRAGLKALGWDIVGPQDGSGRGAGYGAVTEHVSVGNRDNALVGMAGLFSRDIMKGNRTLKEALIQINTAAETYLEKTYGDNIESHKGVAKLIEFLKRDMGGPMRRPLPRGWSDGMDEAELRVLGLAAEDLDEDDVVWEPEEIRSAFTVAVGGDGVKDDPDKFLAVAKDAISRIARQQMMDPIEEESLLKYIVDLSGKQITLAGARKQLGRMRMGPIEGLSHFQIAEAALVKMEEIGGEIRAWSEMLWQYNGSHWTKMDEREVLKQIIQEFGDLRAGLRSNDHAGILKTIKNLRSGELCRVPGIAGINFVNGFLGQDLVLVEHNPDFGMTYCLPYGYEPQLADKCGKFQQMLADYWAEDDDYSEKVTCLGELIALTMFGMMTSVQLAVCLYGVPNSGKSRIVEILQKLMPVEVTATVPPHSWGERFSVIHLVGKLLNFAGELSENAMIDGLRFKMIVSGEMIDAEEKGQPKINFRPRCAHWFASNFLPKSRDSSEGFTRRWIFLHFKRKVPLDKVVIDFEKELVAEEREAIAAWAVAHMTGLRARNFRVTDPPSSIAQRASLENELNNVRAFLTDYQRAGRLLLGAADHEGVVRGSNGAVLGATISTALGGEVDTTPFDTLYQQYRSYCVAQAVSPVGSKSLIKRLEMLEGVFGFRCENLKNPAGLLIQVYRGVTLVDPTVVKRKKAA
jgi:phage/plasmid-associated DNA primase